MALKIRRVRSCWPEYMHDQAFLRKLRHEFNVHCNDAPKRGIRFRLTWMEWLETWIASGRILQRGKGADLYCMARLNDRGPYKIGNVKIILFSENSREAKLGSTHTPEARAKISAANLGKTLTAEHRAKIGRTLEQRHKDLDWLASLSPPVDRSMYH